MAQAYVQSKLVQATAQSPAATFAGNVTSGNTIMALVEEQGASTTCTTMTIANSGTATLSSWTAAWGAIQSPAGGTVNKFINGWYATVTGTGSCTVTVTTNAATIGASYIAVGEFSGLAATPILDLATASAGTAAVAFKQIDFIPTLDNEVIFAFAISNTTTTGAPSVTSPFTKAADDATAFSSTSAYCIATTHGVTKSFTGSFNPGTPGGNTNISAGFSLSGGSTISGSTGVAGASVAYSGTATGTVTADGSGNYSIPILANGTYTLTPSSTGSVFTPSNFRQLTTGLNIASLNFSAAASSTPFAQTIVRDVFTRANSGNLGANWTANSDGTTTGTIGIVSNKAQPAAGANAASFWSANNFQANHYSQCIINGSGLAGGNSNAIGPTVRGSSGGYYRFIGNMNTPSGNVQLAKVVSGAFTALGTASIQLVLGDLFRLEAIGNQLTAYRNGVIVFQVTDTDLATGAPGIAAFMGAASPTAFTQSWEGGSLAFTRQGTVIPIGSNGGTEEPTVLYEANPQILSANPDGKIWKMWFTSGWSALLTVFYAESADGLTWTQYVSNPVISDGTNQAMHGFVLHSGSTYYGYIAYLAGNSGGTSTAIDIWESSNGVTGWSKTHTAVIAIVAATWEASEVADPVVFGTAGAWKMLYQGRSGTAYGVGLATSPDLITWTKYGSNPVITNGTGDALNGKTVTLNGSTYYLWGGTSPQGSNIPTDIAMWTSADLHTWTVLSKNPNYLRVTSDEGPNLAGGQVADACLVELNNVTWMYYDAIDVQAASKIHVNLATSSYTQLQLLGMVFGTWIIAGNCGVAGATVTATGTATVAVTADVNGNYVIPITTAGAYTITPSGGSFSPATSSQTITTADITGVNFSPAGGNAGSLSLRRRKRRDVIS